MWLITVADQAFSWGGVPTPKLVLFCNFFPENCMIMKDFGPPGKHVPGAHLGSPSGSVLPLPSPLAAEYTLQMTRKLCPIHVKIDKITAKELHGLNVFTPTTPYVKFRNFYESASDTEHLKNILQHQVGILFVLHKWQIFPVVINDVISQYFPPEQIELICYRRWTPDRIELRKQSSFDPRRVFRLFTRLYSARDAVLGILWV